MPQSSYWTVIFEAVSAGLLVLEWHGFECCTWLVVQGCNGFAYVLAGGEGAQPSQGIPDLTYCDGPDATTRLGYGKKGGLYWIAGLARGAAFPGTWQT
jgi:hypothetical protein